jgi:transcriptional regulator with XRE-family HTH domain
MAKGLSQKEVILAAGLDKAQYSRMENGKTDPSFSTLDRIAKAIGISLAELFAEGELPEVASLDKSVMEKVSLMESLPETERQTLYIMLDAFVGKRKLKDALAGVLNDVK